MSSGEAVAPIIELSLLVVMVSNSFNVVGSSVWLGWVALEEAVEEALTDAEEAVNEVAWDAEMTLELVVDEAFVVEALATTGVDERLERVANVVLDKGFEEATTLTVLFGRTVFAAEQIAFCTLKTMCRDNRRRVHIADDQCANCCQ